MCPGPIFSLFSSDHSRLLRDAKMASSSTVDRTVVLFGRTGSGKSTLANVLAGEENIFKESFSCKSATYGIDKKVVEVEYGDRTWRVRIVDTMGFGDTRMGKEKVLLELARLSSICEGGINQIFFVTRDRFTKVEMETFQLMSTVILEPDAIKHTTVIRSNFGPFDDFDLVAEEKTDLKELFPLLRRVKKILVVDNTPEYKISGNKDWKKRREESREIVLGHLFGSCTDAYYPDQLKKVQDRITDHVRKETELERRVEELEKQKTADAEEITHLKRKLYEERQAIQEEMDTPDIWGLVKMIGGRAIDCLMQ